MLKTATLLSVLLLAPLVAVNAAEVSPAAAATTTSSASTTIPVQRRGSLINRHEEFVQIAKKGGVDLLFLGDSITDFWRDRGQAVWEKNFAPLNAANFGIWGDGTQHVLWRVQNGELNGLKPKLVVLMIGTNNIHSNKDEEIVAGIQAIIKEIQTRTPHTKVLLLGIFPRTEKAINPWRKRVKQLNEQIAKLDDGGKSIKYLDIGEKFLEADGTLPKTTMPDGLHPNEKGYEIWAEAILPTVQDMLK